MKKLVFLSILLTSLWSFAQKKILQAQSTPESITIDGNLDEAAWENAPIATNFIMFEPDNGKSIPENRKTEIKVLYNNDAIYIGAMMYDDEPNKILKEISQRDNFGTADIFGVFVNGFNDGQQNFEFGCW